jgi:chloride channel 7
VQVTFWAPKAAGAGVTLVMAYLNGTHIPDLLRFRTLLTKSIGAALGVPSGLAIGPEGPMVHIGACVASNLTYANCAVITWLRWIWPWGEKCLQDQDEEDGDGDGVDTTDTRDRRERMRQEHASLWKGMWCHTWEELNEDNEHREFICAGAAAGLSARSPSCTRTREAARIVLCSQRQPNSYSLLSTIRCFRSPTCLQPISKFSLCFTR